MNPAYLFGAWVLATVLISPGHGIMYGLVIVFLIIQRTRFGERVKEQVKTFFIIGKNFLEIILHTTGWLLLVAYMCYLLYLIFYLIPLKGTEIILNLLFPY